MKFTLGDIVYWGSFEATQTSVGCPDCGGTGRLRVTFHDETTVAIECTRCARGYDPPIGRITCYDRCGVTKRGEVVGLDADRGEVEYRIRSAGGTYIVREAQARATEAEASVDAVRLATEADAEERRAIATKEKDTRSWAWNASYHRGCIKRAERDLTYHRAKLAVAAVKAKEPT